MMMRVAYVADAVHVYRHLVQPILADK